MKHVAGLYKKRLLSRLSVYFSNYALINGNILLISQYWMLSKTGEIRRDDACLDYAGQDVILYPCHGSKGNQYWHYNPDVSKLTLVTRNDIVDKRTDRKKKPFVLFFFPDEPYTARQQQEMPDHGDQQRKTPHGRLRRIGTAAEMGVPELRSI